MLKVMVFIDGSWLFYGRDVLRKKINDPNMTIDYGKLPHVLAKKAADQLGSSDYDLVRTYFFHSIPTNVAPQDMAKLESQQEFYEMLKEDYHYETEPYLIDFKKHRLYKEDRYREGDMFKPEEKCVDVALASCMLYFAALPYAYDVAIPVIGDEDYVPVLQRTRALGKRVMIASMHGQCDAVYDPERDPGDSLRVRDIDTIFLDDIILDIVYEHRTIELSCQSPLHKGKREVYTRERPRKGRPFHCPACRELYAQQRTEAAAALREEYPEEKMTNLKEGYYPGRIEKILKPKGYGFIRSKDNKTFFFHATDLKDLIFDQLTELQYVQFLIKNIAGPENNYRGDVREVCPL